MIGLLTDLLECMGVLLLASAAGLVAAGQPSAAAGCAAAGAALIVQSFALVALAGRQPNRDAGGIGSEVA